MTAVLSTSTLAEETKSLPELIQQLRESQQRLLEVPGGWDLRYRIEVREANPAKPEFVFPEGADGELVVRWPKMRARVAGKMVHFVNSPDGSTQTRLDPYVREAEFDFSTWQGAARDAETSVQITDFRHAWSSLGAYPLTFQFFEKMDQFYLPDREWETTRSLPRLLELHPYQITGTEVIDGLTARVVTRADWDQLWFAPERGHLLLKRRLGLGPGRPASLVLNATDLHEIAPDCWLPYRQVREHFEQHSGDWRYTLTLGVQQLAVGEVSEARLRMELPSHPLMTEDFNTGTVTLRFAEDENLDTLLRDARKNVQLRGMPRAGRTWAYAILATLGAMVVALVWWRTWPTG